MSESRELTGEVNPDDLEPTIDIDLKIQKRILVLFSQLDKLDHYQLLGVSMDAEKKEIKNAYFDRMNEFHLDKFYGKNIGSFGPRLQKITQFLTRASDTLSRKKTKFEYDRYLASRKQTLGARESVPPASRPTPPQGTVSARTSRPAVAPIDFVQIPRAPRAPHVPEPEQVREPESADTSAPEPGPEALQDAAIERPKHGSARAEAARRLLARKMGVRPAPRRPASPRPSAPPPGADPRAVREAVDANLKARYDARRNQAKDIVNKYTTLAEEARRKGDWGGAVSAIRNAVQAMPEDARLAKLASEIQSEADEALAPRFLEQGKYEEREGSYERAARSYERAAKGKIRPNFTRERPNASSAPPRLSEEDKRKLVELARKSVSLDNREVDYRLTLAKAYDVTGMRTSAQGEVRRALELDPGNKDAKELQKALR